MLVCLSNILIISTKVILAAPRIAALPLHSDLTYGNGVDIFNVDFCPLN